MKTTDILKGIGILVAAVVAIYLVIRFIVAILVILLPIAVVGFIVYLVVRHWATSKAKG
jgi:hypothetical protein